MPSSKPSPFSVYFSLLLKAIPVVRRPHAGFQGILAHNAGAPCVLDVPARSLAHGPQGCVAPAH